MPGPRGITWYRFRVHLPEPLPAEPLALLTGPLFPACENLANGRKIGQLRSLQSSSPASILKGLNDALAGKGGTGFVTCCCIRYEVSGNLTIASAGHPAPYRSGLEIEVAAGLPVGIVVGTTWEETSITLMAGEQLTIVSDGVVEAENARRELFGFDRTRDVSTQSARQIAQAAKAWGQNDDINVVTIRRTT